MLGERGGGVGERKREGGQGEGEREREGGMRKETDKSRENNCIHTHTKILANDIGKLNSTRKVILRHIWCGVVGTCDSAGTQGSGVVSMYTQIVYRIAVCLQQLPTPIALSGNLSICHTPNSTSHIIMNFNLLCIHTTMRGILTYNQRYCGLSKGHQTFSNCNKRAH